jgi:predicted permease
VRSLYRLGLLLLPPGFRRLYARELLEEAGHELSEHRPGLRRTACAVWLAADLLRTIVREWWDVIRSESGNGLVGGVLVDARWALRSLRRSPAFMFTVTGTLALGIGASTTALGLFDAYLLRSLPYPDSERLMAIWPEQNWSRSMVEMARDGLPALDDVAGVGGATLVLQDGGEPVELFAAHATVNLLDVVGVPPRRGRGFVVGDGAPGAEPVALLSHTLWVERFGGDRGVVGRSIELGGDGHLRRTVVGIMPEDYLPLQGRGVDVWVPVVIDPAAEEYDNSYFMAAIGRLAPGATPARAATDTRSWADRVRESQPGWFSAAEVARATAVPLAAERTASRRTALLIAMSAALLVLIVACANVANLIVARTTARERELSVRAALGAGRTRTARLVIVEVCLLAAVGCVLGTLVAYGFVRILEARMPAALPSWGLSFDLRWIVGAVGLASASAMVAGAAPAVQAARRDPAAAMSGGRGASDRRGASRLQELLSAGQLALATAGIAAMGLLGRSLVELGKVDPGFDRTNAVTFRVTAPPAAYPGDDDVVRFFREARAALAAVPGVEHVGFGSRVPLGGGDSRTTVAPEGMERADGEPAPEAWHRLVTPGYLEALGTRILDGRIPIASDDRDDLPKLVVINEAAARLFWPDEPSAVGKRFYGPGRVEWLTVAGVVENVRERGPRSAVLPGLYIPHRDWPWRSMYAMVRTRQDPTTLVPALKEAIWSVAGGVPVTRLQTLGELVERGLQPARLLTVLAAIAGSVTLLLGALGIYGVVSHTVARRTRELGVRAALGADRSQLLRGELEVATRIVSLGLFVGLLAAWMAGNGLRSVLHGVGALDPPSFVGAVVLLGTVAYAAASIPARRAARVDPARVIREE